MDLSNSPQRVLKAVGADIELGNYIGGCSRPDGTGAEASRMLLRHISGVSGSLFTSRKSDPQDMGRKWLRNGSCCYLDLNHLEIALAEVRTAWDFTSGFHAQLRIVQAAQQAASAELRPGTSLEVLACNSDGSGASWGSHLNFLVSRTCFDRIFHERFDYLLWLASFQASSLAITGQGKVGSENGARRVNYQLSQRADFIEEVVGLQTTYMRPIINSRDEALCDGDNRYARFHHISNDVNLCHTLNVLKMGMWQIMLAMVESESPLIKPHLILKEPVRAFSAYSHDPDLNVVQATLAEQDLSALDLQRRFFAAAAEFVASGECEDTVPRAGEIIALWSSTLDLLAARDWEALSSRLDWVLKRILLEGAIEENGFDWESPEIKQLDLLYGSLNRHEGLYWAMEEAGCVDMLVSECDIEQFTEEPPSDTRAYTRGHLLQLFERDAIVSVDWDRLRIREPRHGYYGRTRTISLNEPMGHSIAENGELLHDDSNISPQKLLDILASPTEDYHTVAVGHARNLLVLRHPNPMHNAWNPTKPRR